MVVWIIDDDRAILSLLTMALEQEGIKTHAFTSVGQVLEELQAKGLEPDICIADWTLPDGPILKAQSLMQNCRLIIMSGDLAVQDMLPEGTDWLPKPFRLADLNRVLLLPYP